MKCYDPLNKTVVETIHVQFDDESIPINGHSITIPSLLDLPNLSSHSSTIPGSGVNDVEPTILPVPNSDFLPVPVDNTLENQSTLPNNTETLSNHSDENQQEPYPNDFNQPHSIAEDQTISDTTTSNPNQSLTEAITQNELIQATPIAVPHSGMIEPEVIYKSSAGLWKYVDPSSKTIRWDPANLPAAGSKRTRKPRNGYAESLVATGDEQNTLYRFALSTVITQFDSPTYHEAMNRSDKPKWDIAIQKEYEALFLNETFILLSYGTPTWSSSN